MIASECCRSSFQRVLMWLMLGGLLLWTAEAAWLIAIGKPSAPEPASAAAVAAAAAAALHGRRRRLVVRTLRWGSYLVALCALAGWVYYERLPLLGLLLGAGGEAASRRPLLSPLLAAVTMARVCGPPVAFFILQVRPSCTWTPGLVCSAVGRAEVALQVWRLIARFSTGTLVL